MKTTITANYRLRIRRDQLAHGAVRIAFLSDLHNCVDEQRQSEILSWIDAAEPDFVLCGGDMIVARPGRSVQPAVNFMTALAARHPLYVATGNHEYRARIYPEDYGTMYRDYRDPVESAGAIFLDQRDLRLQIGDLPIRLYGFDLDRYYYGRFKRRTLPVSELRGPFGAPDLTELSILLAHNPRYYRTYLEWGADVTLSGHYHGGVVQVGKKKGLISPEFRPFPPLAHGHLEQGGHHMIVSAGIGEHTIPLRLNNPRELVILTIRTGSEAGMRTE